MLSVPKLDDLSFEQIFERARSRIPVYTDEWTDFNHHDPGITALQTLAWLVDTLNYYMDATGEQHRLKYLGLLGLRLEQAAAVCNIALSSSKKNIVLGRGAKLPAGSVVFETAHSYSGTANAMRSLFQETDGEFLDLAPFAGVDGEYATLFTYAEDSRSTLYIGFERELKSQARFYVDVLAHPARNPFEDDFALSALEWEYWDGNRWQSEGLTEDGTCGFLRSGFISLSLDSGTRVLRDHPALPRAHYLRAVLNWNAYDVLPRIGSIHMNCVKAVQTDTCAQALELAFDGEAELIIDYHVGAGDIVCVAVGGSEGYSLWYEHVIDEDSLCDVREGDHPWQRVICFDRERFKAFPEPGQSILVTVTNADMYDKMRLGVTGGFASERLTFDLENLYEARLALVEQKDGRPCFRLWEPCDNILEAACDAKVFQYIRASEEVLFGDGIAGMQPEAGQLVVAVTAKSSLLERGNIRAGQLNRFTDEAYGELGAYNLGDATGGKRPKTSLELEKEVESKIYATTRAVNVRDYVDIARAVPGLMIDNVSVISAREYDRCYGTKHGPNTVLITVKPYSENERRPILSEAYRQRIRGHIEKYRLLATDVRILQAKYLGVEADGRIVLTENTPATRRRVEEKLFELIDFSFRKEFGADVVSGKVFSHLEMLDCVTKVSQLSFSCMGEGGQKSEQGDIIVYPDALAYLSKINIEFV